MMGGGECCRFCFRAVWAKAGRCELADGSCAVSNPRKQPNFHMFWPVSENLKTPIERLIVANANLLQRGGDAVNVCCSGIFGESKSVRAPA